MKSTEAKKNDLLKAEDIEPHNVKERITIYIDEDVLDEIRAQADGGKYQTLLNNILREAVFGKTQKQQEGFDPKAALKKLERKIELIDDRERQLERQVQAYFKKSGSESSPKMMSQRRSTRRMSR